MANLEEATERLQRALVTLDEAVGENDSRNAALRGDIDVVKEENTQLKDALESLSERLDRTIGRVQKMMEG